MEDDKRIVKNDFVIRNNEDGVFVVINSGQITDCATLYFLTGVGEYILSLFDKETTFGQLCNLFFLKFPDISQTVLKEDLVSFLTDCTKFGILSIL